LEDANKLSSKAFQQDVMARLIEMRRGQTPTEINLEDKDDKTVLQSLNKVWKGDIDGIMVMRQ